MNPRIKNYDKILPINELYTCIQAEGSRAGTPTVAVRVTGCPARCYFHDGGWCDSWYSSIHPEPGKYTFNDIIKIYKENPHIREMMLTGGSALLYPDILNEVTHFCTENRIKLTFETEGSFYVETDHAIDLLSISPKFSNSIPVLGMETPGGKTVTQDFINRHKKCIGNIEDIAELILNSNDFQIKPVIDKGLKVMKEVEDFLERLEEELKKLDYEFSYIIPPNEGMLTSLKEKTYLMPAGATRGALLESYGPVMNYARDHGYRFTGRPQIIAFGNKRYV